ncbi:hypothetical protein ANN_09518 [Periplaneta americana]|uniref:Per a allergen n=1 Tax=Periplaneta americana TaxID=6978 RepID=A0ABQ8TNK9_PERAM|nr:hypothetical protein ANN_09518 [Periplaneta americana]
MATILREDVDLFKCTPYHAASSETSRFLWVPTLQVTDLRRETLFVRTTRGTEETKGMAYIPFYGPISGKIGRLLRKHGIKTIHKPPTKIQNLLRPVKDDLGLRTPGVYKIPLAQHSLETGHKIDFGATTILDKTSGYWDLVIKEAIEIQLDGNNFNRDGGLQLSTAWKPAINTLKPPAHGRQLGPATSS